MACSGRVRSPELSFGEFIKLTPDELREQLSALEVEPCLFHKSQAAVLVTGLG